MARPPFDPTDEHRAKVAIAAGGGMSHEEIALGLGISRGTLEKYFEHELSVGAYEKRIEVLVAQHAAALKGNVTAQKSYLQSTPRAAAPPEPDDIAPAKLGKKDQADVDARSAQDGSHWDTLLPRSPGSGSPGLH